jgi:hypothetical protein
MLKRHQKLLAEAGLEIKFDGIVLTKASVTGLSLNPMF